MKSTETHSQRLKRYGLKQVMIYMPIKDAEDLERYSRQRKSSISDIGRKALRAYLSKRRG